MAKGKKSVKTSGRKLWGAYRRYVRAYKEVASKYGRNITPMLDYKDFKSKEYGYLAYYDIVGSKNSSVKKFAMMQVLSTKKQSLAAADNFNSKLRIIRAKAKMIGEDQLSEYEFRLLNIYKLMGKKLITSTDIRSKSTYYQLIVNAGENLEDGETDDAFGS